MFNYNFDDHNNIIILIIETALQALSLLTVVGVRGGLEDRGVIGSVTRTRQALTQK